ncbi:MAG: class I SAM-dependent RNA methyltransferase [Parvibaculaceae bacterium]
MNSAREVRIESVGHRGDGIAPGTDGPLFVPLALPGEKVEVEPSGAGRARLIRVVEASPDRVEPFCPHFGACGGCAVQHWGEPPYRAWKRDLVRIPLRQRGIDTEVGDLVDAHGEGRRRATFHARKTEGGIAVGFMALRSNAIVDIARCPVLSPALARAPAIAHDLAQLLAGARPIDIAFTATATGIDCAVSGARAPGLALRTRLAEQVRMHGLARLSLGGEVVAETAAPLLRFGRAEVVAPPAAFLQPTEAGELALWEAVREGVGRARKVADLFCGMGPFTFRIAEAAQVSGFDSDRASIAALQQAARRTSKLKPVTTEARDLFREPLSARELASFDVVVIDPPRQGAEAQAREIARSKVPVVVSVSCDPGTFARDAAILLAGGYRLRSVRPVDQFKWTPHVECVGVFRRQT